MPAATIQGSQGRPTARYFVPTITCPSCAARIKANASKDPGVIEVAVNLSTQRVTVVYDPEKTAPERIAETIRAGGNTVLSGELAPRKGLPPWLATIYGRTTMAYAGAAPAPRPPAGRHGPWE